MIYELSFKNKYCLLLFSAIFSTLPYIAPDSCWFVIFYSLVPFYHLLLTTRLRAAEFFIWAFIAYGFHYYGYLYSFATCYGRTRSYALGAQALCLVAIVSAGYSLIFTQAQRLAHRYQLTGMRAIALWVIISYAWLWVFDGIVNLAIARNWGFAIHEQLIPLAVHPLFLRPFLVFDHLAMLVIYTCSGILTLLLTSYPIIFWLTLIPATTLLYVAPYWLPAEQVMTEIPVQKIIHLPVILPRQDLKSMQTVMLSMQGHFKQICSQHPDTELIILPESALPIDFSKNKLLHEWSSAKIGKEVHILIGAEYRTKFARHNSLYWLCDGQIKHRFDKRKTIQLLEDKIHRDASNSRPCLSILNYNLVPYICSELFFNYRPDDDIHLGACIVALCSDFWIKKEIAKKQLLLLAHVKAAAWSRPIVYVTWNHAFFIDGRGISTQLRSVHPSSTR